MKIHYNRFYLLILCIAILLCGCSNLDGTEMQRCTDAIERLKKLNQMHYISTTLIGESSDSLEISAVSEYWISGNEWAYCSSLSNSETIWQLTLDNANFAAMETNNQRQWQAVSDTSREPDSWVPPEDFSLYTVTSAKKENGNLIVTMTSDVTETVPAAYGNTTYKDFQVVITLDSTNAIVKYELSFCSTITQKDDSIGNIYWKMVKEYLGSDQTEIDKFLDTLYQEAISS